MCMIQCYHSYIDWSLEGLPKKKGAILDTGSVRGLSQLLASICSGYSQLDITLPEMSFY